MPFLPEAMNISYRHAFPLLLLFLTGCGADLSRLLPSPSADAPQEPPTAAPANPPDSSQEPDLLGDRLIIPGDRAGAMSQTISRADLAALVSEDSLQDQDIHVGEGVMEPGTIVYPDSPEDTVTIVWQDAERTQPLSLRDFGTAWATPEGLGINSSFSTLQSVLGDFELYGYGWDYGGTVQLEGTALEQYSGLLILRAYPTAETVEVAQADYNAVLGDSLYSSSSSHIQALAPVVEEIVMFFK
ncbi:MAG: hypothetical protein KME20_01985 [Kaiparowitsia implicata GSE-PSE-MK54-09C]|jgi:hypothetical protein|nr:hypothetical protein [Kaiparowitsia implicata GSE-PSE-MK54-09C]